MATGEDAAEIEGNISDAATCPLCSKNYQNPKLLPCGHSVCCICLQSYIDKTLDQGTFLCPFCHTCTKLPNDGLDGLPSSVSSMEVQEDESKVSVDISRDPCTQEVQNSADETRFVDCDPGIQEGNTSAAESKCEECDPCTQDAHISANETRSAECDPSTQTGHTSTAESKCEECDLCNQDGHTSATETRSAECDPSTQAGHTSATQTSAECDPPTQAGHTSAAETICEECDPCTQEGHASAAESRCVECRENMCHECAKAHAKLTVSRYHHITPLSEDSKDDISMIKCRNHREESVSHFCVPCQIWICLNCKASDHTDHEVVEVQDAIQENRSDIKREVLAFENKGSDISAVLDQIAGNITHLREGKQCVTNIICEEREKLIALINRIADRAIGHSDALIQDQIKIQEMEFDKAKLLQSEAQNHISYAKTLLTSGSDVEVLFGHSDLKQKIASLAAKSASVPVYQIQSLQTTLDSSIIGGLESHFKLSCVDISPEQLEAVPTTRSENIAVVKMGSLGAPREHKTILCHNVTGMALDKDTLYACFQGKLGQLCSTSRVNLSDSYTTEGRAYGVCMDGHTIMVSKKSDGPSVRVQLVVGDPSLSDRTRLMLSFESSHPTVAFGRPADGRRTYFVTEQSRFPAVHHIDYTGNILQTYGERELKSPRGIAVDQQGNVIVSDPLLNDVIIFNRDGSIKLRLRYHNNLSAQQLSWPQGVYVDENGYIYATSRVTDSVLLFSPKGDYIRTILTRNDGICNPTCVAGSSCGGLAVDINLLSLLLPGKINIYTHTDYD